MAPAAAGDFIAVHDRQADVQEDDVGLVIASELECLLAVVRGLARPGPRATSSFSRLAALIRLSSTTRIRKRGSGDVASRAILSGIIRRDRRPRGRGEGSGR